jgi:hypothetical protein
MLEGGNKGEKWSASLVIEKSGENWTWIPPIFQKIFPGRGGCPAAPRG